MKNKILPIALTIIIMLSIALNIKQYSTITSLQTNEHNINKDLKASIQDLILAIDSLTNENYKDSIPLYSRISGKIYTMVMFSTYQGDEKIGTCFREIDHLFINGSEELFIYKEELKNLLNNIINNTNELELNEKACEDLNDFINNNIYNK